MKRAVAWLMLALAVGGSAVAQTLPTVKGTVSPAVPTTTNFFFDVLQTTPAVCSAPGLPALPNKVLSTAQCLVGTADGVAPGGSAAIHFVGNVLCLDPGPGGDFKSFTSGGVDCANCVVQGVTLRKVEPRIPKCPDVYPGVDTIQSPSTTGLRTFFPLKMTPCGTEFTLSLEVATVDPTIRGPFPPRVRNTFTLFEVRNFHFRVTVTPDTLAWVVDALHNEPLGVCEVPCISDEALFRLLLSQANNVATTAAALDRKVPQTIVNLNNAFDVFEATIVKNATFLTSVSQVTTDAKTGAVTINPCAIFPNGVPGNNTVANFGFGIVDTLENPCACKLIADIFCLKQRLIGTDP